MGKYCTDCAKEIEKVSGDMMSFQEVVRCKECLGTKDNDSFGGFGKMGDGGFGDGNIGTKSKSS